MHYMGSKLRHAKFLVPIILSGRRTDQIYVEPFVGGGNIIVNVPQGAGRIANDKNYAMVQLLDHLGNKGWVPPVTMTKKEWLVLMKEKNRVQTLSPEAQALFAFAATGPTFGSKWADQWARDYEGMEGTRYRQAREAALDDAPHLTGIEFHSGSYDALQVPDGSLVYCDPPYVGTSGYLGATTTIKVGDGNHNEWNASKFWRWADDLVQRGCSVYVSEYKGPLPSMFNVPATPEQAAELKAAQAARRALDDDTAASDAINAANERVFEAERAKNANGAARADQWTVLWEKEVTSDFSATRNKDDRVGDTGKREVERLFHREP